MSGVPLKPLIQQLIKDTLDEQALINNQTANEYGQIINVNDDGTVDVQTQSGVYLSCGTPTQRVIGEAVVLLTADGQKVAI